MTIPDGTELKVFEDSADTRHMVLPVAPKNAGALSREELEKAAERIISPTASAPTIGDLGNNDRLSIDKMENFDGENDEGLGVPNFN